MFVQYLSLLRIFAGLLIDGVNIDRDLCIVYRIKFDNRIEIVNTVELDWKLPL